LCACRIFLKLASTISYARNNPVRHRDPKPSNILFTAAGDVRILDFGNATLLEGGLTWELCA